MPEESIPSKELPNDFNGEQTQAQTRILLRKMDMRILPVSALIYLLNSMDRSNVGNAKVMNQEEGHDLLTSTGLSQMQYKITLMAFAIAYGIFEVPSNYLIKRLRPSRWIAFLMVCWGMITMAMGGVKDFASLAVVRFLLGTFEAGFFPGLSFCLTFWYRPEERSVRIAFIYASAALASAFGGLVAFGVAHMDGVGGLVAWRWLFILEGLPSVLLSVVIWNIFPDFPETALWLNEDERILAVARLGPSSESKSTNKDLSWEIVKETLMDWRLWIHYFAYFGVSLTFGSLSLFTPTIIKGLGYTSLHAQILAAPPYAIAYVVTIPVAYCADAWNRRGLVAGVCSLVGASGFIASACLAPDAYKQRYGALIIAASGCYASVPPLIGWVSSNVHPAVTGMVVAMNVSFGAYGQIVGVWIYKSEEESRGFPTGHWVNAGALLSVGVACGVLHGIYWRRNRRKDGGGEDCEVRVEEWKL